MYAESTGRKNYNTWFFAGFRWISRINPILYKVLYIFIQGTNHVPALRYCLKGFFFLARHTHRILSSFASKDETRITFWSEKFLQTSIESQLRYQFRNFFSDPALRQSHKIRQIVKNSQDFFIKSLKVAVLRNYFIVSSYPSHAVEPSRIFSPAFVASRGGPVIDFYGYCILLRKVRSRAGAKKSAFR